MKKFFLALGLCLLSAPAFAYTVYPGCNVPGTFAGNTWYFDSVNGKTEAAWTALGIPISSTASPRQGDKTHPWNSLKAVWGLKGAIQAGVFGPDTGYDRPLLSAVGEGTGHGTGPINGGDQLLLETGSYGDVSIGDFNFGVYQSGWLTIKPDTGASPVIGTLQVTRTNKLVFDSLKVQETLATGATTWQNSLVSVSDQGATLPTSDIIFYNMDISSQDHSASVTQTQAQLSANERNGFLIFGQPGNGTNGAPYSSCISLTNSKIHEVYNGMQMFGNNSYFSGNEISYFTADGSDYGANNLIITKNYIHDSQTTANGVHTDAMQGQNGPLASGVAYNSFSNILIDSNLVVRVVDPALQFAQYLQGIDIFDEDWTNITMTNNIVITDSCHGITMASVHNGLMANNTIIFDGLLAPNGCSAAMEIVSQTHQGPPSTNSRMTNNVGPALNLAGTGPDVVADHNVITNGTWPGAKIFWQVNGANQFLGSPGTYSNGTSYANVIDTTDSAGEFTTYSPSTNTYNAIPKAGSILTTLGTDVGAPSTTLDINGNVRTAPWWIGAITHAPATPTPPPCGC